MSVEIDISACCGDSFMENCCCPCTTPSCNASPPACTTGADYIFNLDMATACANSGNYPAFTFQVPVKPCRSGTTNNFDLSGMVKFLYNTKLRGRNHSTTYTISLSLAAPLPNYPACNLYINVTESLAGGTTYNRGNGTTPLVLTFGPVASNPSNACIDGGSRRVCIVAKSFGTDYDCCPDQAVMLNVTFSASIGSGGWSTNYICCQDSAFSSYPLYSTNPPTTTALAHVNCGTGSHGFLHGANFSCTGAGTNCGVNCNDNAPSTISGAGCGSSTCPSASCTATRVGTLGCCNQSGPPFTCPPGGSQASQVIQYNFTGTCTGGTCEGACC